MKWRKMLIFPGTKTKNNNARFEFDVHRKPAETNVQIKPHSCKPSGIIISIFKGILAKANTIFSKNTWEIEYLTDMFCENGHDQKTLQKTKSKQ